MTEQECSTRVHVTKLKPLYTHFSNWHFQEFYEEFDKNSQEMLLKPHTLTMLPGPLHTQVHLCTSSFIMSSASHLILSWINNMCFILCLKGKCCWVFLLVWAVTQKKLCLQHKRQLSPVQFASIPLSTEGHKNRVTVSYEAAILGNDFIMLNFALKITVLYHWYFCFGVVGGFGVGGIKSHYIWEIFMVFWTVYTPFSCAVTSGCQWWAHTAHSGQGHAIFWLI